jgi:hypothetical protein
MWFGYKVETTFQALTDFTTQFQAQVLSKTCITENINGNYKNMLH